MMLLVGYYHDYTAGAALQQGTSNCSCDMQPKVTLLFNLLPICNLPLVPTWMLALVIGVLGGQQLHRLGPSVPGSLSYFISFFMYAVMITSGLFVHCLFLVECGAAPSSKAYVSAALIDASLTSCIAISFIFDGLVDLNILPEYHFFTILLMGLTYTGIFYANFGRLVNMVALYNGSILVGCSIYMLCQLVQLYSRRPCRLWSLFCLTAAGIAGGLSFLLFSQYSCLLCTALGAWSIEGAWYYGSDIAMFFLLFYVLATRQHSPNTATTTDNRTPTKAAMTSSYK